MSSSWLYGIHTVEAALRNQPDTIATIWFAQPINNKRLQQLQHQVTQLGITQRLAKSSELVRHSGGGRHQGVMAQLRKAANNVAEHELPALLDAITGTPLLLILDGIQDPHNLGACLRSADAAGVHAVIAPADRAASLTPTALKVASGATVPFVQVTNLARCLRMLQQRAFWIIGTADDAVDSLYNTDLRQPLAIVLGAEGSGLRRLTREHCDQLISIPMLGSVSSLNVSVAAGVLLFEALRQRQQ